MPPRSPVAPPTAVRAAALAATLAATLAGTSACSGSGDGRAEGERPADPRARTLVYAALADADVLLPSRVGSLPGQMVIDLVFDPLAEIGESMNTVGDEGFRPRLARRWTWSPDSLTVRFELDPRARWHDGRPVTARDVAFTYALYKDGANGSRAAAALARIDSVTTSDERTAVVWFRERYPEQFYDATYHVRVVPRHVYDTVAPAALRAHPLARSPVGSGRFRFARWNAGASLELAADTSNWRGRPGLDRVVLLVSPDPTTAFARVARGEADITDPVRPTQLADIAADTSLALMTERGADYIFVAFNTRANGRPGAPHPLFGDRALRRALSMAIDRETVVRGVMDTLAVVSTGPMSSAQWAADRTVPQIPHDTAAAARLLDSLGWRDRDGDGVRERNGRALRFDLIVPASSAPRRAMATALAEQWRRAGVDARVQQADHTAIGPALSSGRFDAAFHSWHTGPSAAMLATMWGSRDERGRGASNYGRYASAAFDAAVDSASRSLDRREARRLYRRAYEIIVADAPALWVYEPRFAAVVRKRFQRAGGRPGAWWAGLGDWKVVGR